jgi:pimeloyl-ACP methyl ester carboxylesterase
MTYVVFEKEREVVVSDGTPIRYTVRGEGKAPGEAIVLANGWSCSDSYWVDILPRLEASGHRIVLSDTRAHGESGLPRDPGRRARNLTDDDLSVPRLAADLVEVCRDAGVDHAVLVGHSMGVQTILETYRIAPHLVRGLVTMAGAYENPLNTFYGRSFWNQLFPLGRVAIGAVPPALTAAWWKVGDNAAFGLKVAQLIGAAGPKVTKEHLAPYITHMSTKDPVVLFKAIDAMRRHSAADVLPQVRVPVLLLVAGKDVFTPPAVAQHMHEVLPDSELVEFPDATHCLPVEEPEALAGLIDRFASELVPTKTKAKATPRAKS